MRFKALIQARLESSRLPAKVLEKIGQNTIIEHIVARLDTLSGAGLEICFAIAGEKSPDLADFLTERGFAFHTGSVFDVLQRFLDASDDLRENDYVIRVTADNPFIDKDQLGLLISRLKQNPVDYSYTADLPLGMGTEVIRVAALRSIMMRALPLKPGGESELKPHHREHVTPFIRENPHLYDINPLRLDETVNEADAKERVAGIRLTIDEPADLAVCRRVFEHFNRLGKPHFNALDIIQLRKNNPEMLAGNETVRQNTAQSVDPRAK